MNTKSIKQTILKYTVTALAVICLHTIPLSAQAGVLDDEYNGGPNAASSSSEIAPQPCDPRYWETMSARAWMEAEREIMQNQNLIFKPDSVLEYTCFDSMVSHGAHYLGDIFVHTDYFGKVIIERGSAQAQEVALKNVVYESMKTYLTQNYNFDFFADRAKKMRNPPKITNAGNAVIVPTAGGKYSSCKIMAEVWESAKCLNFVDNEDFQNTDAFYPFITLQPGPGSEVSIPGYDKIEDVRYWPKKCANPMTSDEWIAQDNIANNKKEEGEIYPFRDPLKADFEKVRKMVEPGGCSENAQGIETGVTVILSGSGSGKADKVCTNPGCTYLDGKCQ